MIKFEEKVDFDLIQELDPVIFKKHEIAVQLAIMYSKCLETAWDLKFSLFQYEKYAQIVEILDFDKVLQQKRPENGQFFDEFEQAIEENKIDVRNEAVLTLIFQEYWLEPIKKYIKSWNPVLPDDEINLADIFQKWSYITPLRFLKNVVFEHILPKIKDSLQDHRIGQKVDFLKILQPWSPLFSDIGLSEDFDSIID